MKLTTFIPIVVVILGLIYINQSKSNGISKKIVDLIDIRTSNNTICVFNMSEVTDFKWDKMLIYDLGCSNFEISKALGVEYTETVDLMTGLVFVYENKIVFREQVPYNPEHPLKLRYSVNDNNNDEKLSYRLLPQKNAIFKGSKTEVDGVYYYRIDPLNVN